MDEETKIEKKKRRGKGRGAKYSQIFHVWISRDLYEAICAKALALGLKPSEIARAAITREVAEYLPSSRAQDAARAEERAAIGSDREALA